MIKGSIDVKNDGVMFLSMPYEKGWSVYSDGQEIETFPVANAMLGVKLPSGHHEITMKYKPEGFTAGLLASGASAVMFLLMSLAEMLIRRKKKASAPASEAEGQELQPENSPEETAEVPEQVTDTENDTSEEQGTAAGAEQETAEISPENGKVVD